MPVIINNPVIIPAKAAVTCDKLALFNLNIQMSGEAGDYAGYASVAFYSEDENGARTYARRDDGSYFTEQVAFRSIYATSAHIPEVAAVVMALLAALKPIYDAKKAVELNRQQSNLPVFPGIVEI
jgi:hypothetical protein